MALAIALAESLKDLARSQSELAELEQVRGCLSQRWGKDKGVG